MRGNTNRARLSAPGFPALVMVPTVSLRAKRRFMLGGRQIEEGSVIIVNEREARALIAVGYSERVDAKPEELPALLKRRGPDKKPRKRRVYKRRDMVSEE